jgi:glycosyltransferase involved in cell wall biosynthesis
MPSTKLYLADANSTDGTPQDVALTFAGWLDIEVMPGGLPTVGRNAGARRACTPYLLFIDADIELSDATLVRRAVELMKSKDLHCVTTNIACPSGPHGTECSEPVSEDDCVATGRFVTDLHKGLYRVVLKTRGLTVAISDASLRAIAVKEPG